MGSCRAFSWIVLLACIGIQLVHPDCLFSADCRKAESLFSRALHQDPDSLDVGTLLEKERLYKEALELCPSYPEAANNLGDVYESLGRYAEAIEEYEKAFNLRRSFAYPCFGLGDVYLKTGEYRKAVDWYKRGLAVDPGDATTLELLKRAETLGNQGVIPKDEIVRLLGREESLTRGPGDSVKLSFGADERTGSIPFAYGSAQMSPQASAQLAELGKALSSRELAGYAFEIGGHTDVRGSEAYNMDLSLRRALAVRSFISKQAGIPQARLGARGYGESRPVASGVDEASHALNRRVEIVRLGTVGKAGRDEPTHAGRPPGVAISLDTGFLYREGGIGKRQRINSEGNTVLRTARDAFQVFFRPHQDCYVYVLHKDASGSWTSLFPTRGASVQTNPVRKDRSYWVAGKDEGVVLRDDSSGKEYLYLLASLKRLPELDAPEALNPKRMSALMRGFEAEGITSIGSPTRGALQEGFADLQKVVESVGGPGVLVRAVSFIHQ